MLQSAKSKLKSKVPATSKEELKRACSSAASGLQTTLQIVKEAVGDAGVPGLQAGIGGLLFVLGVVKVDPYYCLSPRLLTITRKCLKMHKTLKNLYNASIH